MKKLPDIYPAFTNLLPTMPNMHHVWCIWFLYCLYTRVFEWLEVAPCGVLFQMAQLSGVKLHHYRVRVCGNYLKPAILVEFIGCYCVWSTDWLCAIKILAITTKSKSIKGSLVGISVIVLVWNTLYKGKKNHSGIFF